MKNSSLHQERYFNLSENYFWLSAHYDVCEWMLKSYLEKMQSKYFTPPMKLLDAGCGPGNFILRLKDHGIVCGTDFSEDALHFCASKHQFPVFRSDLEQLPVLDHTIDCVVAIEVLEHVKGDNQALLEFYRILKPGGIGLISVPAFMSLWGDHDEIYDHFRRYGKQELIQLVTKAGFKIQQCQYLKCLFFPFLFALRKAKQLFRGNGPGRDDFYSVGRFVNRFLRWVILAEAKSGVSAAMPFGTSLLCVFKKPL